MDFIALAPNAAWRVGPSTSEPIAAPNPSQSMTYGVPTATQALGVVNTLVLENDTRHPAINMRPGNTRHSVVCAHFDVPPSPPDSVFRASIGFTRAAHVGTPRSDGARFEVWATLADGREVALLFTVKVPDGALRPVELDLGLLVHQGPVRLTLAVFSGPQGRADDAVWVAPRVEPVRQGVVTRARVDVQTFGAARGHNDEGAEAEPYLYARLMVLDGHGVQLTSVAAAHARLLAADSAPDASTAGAGPADLHGNLPRLKARQRRDVPPDVGRLTVALRPIAPLPDMREKSAQVAERLGLVRVGLILVLMEEDDGPSDGAVRNVVVNAERELLDALNADLRSALLSWLQPLPQGAQRATLGEAFSPLLDGLEARLATWCDRRIRRAIRNAANWPANPDDHHGTHVRVFTINDLLRAGIMGEHLTPIRSGGYSIGYRFGLEP